MSMIERAQDEKIGWTCPDCATFYFCIGSMRFCPVCKAVKDKAEQEYWDNKAAGMRSIASSIVSRILDTDTASNKVED